MKPILSLLLILICLCAVTCRKTSKDSTSTTLLLIAATADRADIYPVLGFPGTTNQVSGDFPGLASEYTVTIGSTSAAGITLPGSGTLQFTMPALSGIVENTTVPIVIKRNGSELLNKTIRYRPAPTINLNVPNGYVRRVTANDTSSFFTFTVTGAGDHIFDIFGYLGTNLDLYYLTSPTTAPIAIATSGMTDAEFERVNLAAGTYFLQIKWVSGFDSSFRTNIANGEITPAATSNEVGTYLRCYDFMGAGTAANAAGGCATVNTDPQVPQTGRCTYPSNSGIATRHYYIRNSDGYGFDPGYAQTTCTQPGFDSPNPDKAIFQP